MSDYIRRDKALAELHLDHKDVIYIDKQAAAERIRKIPSIEPCEDAISRADAIANIEQWKDEVDSDRDEYFNLGLWQAVKEIKSQPSVAPSIDIVRCKECKHWQDWGNGETHCCCLDGGIGSLPDDFCSYGEVKGADNE